MPLKLESNSDIFSCANELSICKSNPNCAIRTAISFTKVIHGGLLSLVPVVN